MACNTKTNPVPVLSLSAVHLLSTLIHIHSAGAAQGIRLLLVINDVVTALDTGS